MTRLLSVRRMLFISVTLSCQFALAADMLVSKQRFEMTSFTTFGGKTISPLAVGFESYGQLNAAKDNVILITHYFSANSHAAGKYSPSDPSAGYWDAIIGPGKAIDTQRFFVLSVDSLVNLNAYDPHTITTGPASLDPATGKPYGLSFPVVTIRDFVNVQKAVLESLGIHQLYAVIGASMGSMQAIEWATAYPQWVERMISVVGTAEIDNWASSLLEQWALPVRLDPHWQQGNYYDSIAPAEGLIAAMMAITQSALTPEFFNQLPLSGNLKEANRQAMLQDISQSPAIVNWLRQRATARVANMDANHLLYLVRANQLFIAGHQQDLASGLKNLTAKTLFMPAHNDMLLMPYMSQQAFAILQQQGKHPQLTELSGPLGHLNGVQLIQQQATRITEFLAH